MGSKITRIDSELAKELERIAKKNDMKLVEASREIARELRRKRNKKIIREIQF